MSYKLLSFVLALCLILLLWRSETKPIAVIEPEILVDTLYPTCPHCGWDTMLYLHTNHKEILR